MPKIFFASDTNASAVIDNFETRKWIEVSSEQNIFEHYWNIFWASAVNAKIIFSLDNGIRLSDDQIINHFPNYYELTRKDLMVKNIKRYRKQFEKEGNPLGEKDDSGNYKYLNIFPTTFLLPLDYTIFAEEYKKNPGLTWILKPSSKSRGEGISIINRLAQVKQWAQLSNTSISRDTYQGPRETYVISRYIENPLLIGGKKFDLRMYVLVTSYKPLKCYVHKQGFCRFCTVRYDKTEAEFRNMFIHLTNVSVQKLAADYNSYHGGKWSINNFKSWLEGTRGEDVAEKLFNEIYWIIYHSLRAVANMINNDRHCFECYGYDIIIDDNLKPWLVEVNASPSLNSTTASDRVMKYKLINDVLNIVLPEKEIPDAKVQRSVNEASLGEFDVLYDEEQANEETVYTTLLGNRSGKPPSLSRTRKF